MSVPISHPSNGDAVLKPGDPFQIRLSSSGAVMDVPADRTVLEVLRDAAIELPWCCEVGICGACVTGVLQGVPDHGDFFLNPEQKEKGDRFTPCCSRSKTSLLVLDL